MSTSAPVNCMGCKHMKVKDGKRTKYGASFNFSCRLLKEFKKDCHQKVKNI